MYLTAYEPLALLGWPTMPAHPYHCRGTAAGRTSASPQCARWEWCHPPPAWTPWPKKEHGEALNGEAAWVAAGSGSLVVSWAEPQEMENPYLCR